MDTPQSTAPAGPAADGRSLVLVVGAGASKEAGLPVGAELKRVIAQGLDIRYDHHQRVSGDSLIDQAFRIIARSRNAGREDINPMLQASWRIRDAMPQALSIDNFIDAHRNEPLIATCGKIAIARCILDAEAASPLRPDRSNIHNKINFAVLESTWFNSFFQLLTENCQREEVASRFSKVAIICFNYDRCIEQYLHLSLQNYYAMSADEAASAMASLEMHHPYGVVGTLPWTRQQQAIDFGAIPSATQLVALAGELRTFSEGVDREKSDIDAIRGSLATAQRIAFLGFAFHKLNLELLFGGVPAGTVRRCPTYGTALGISGADVHAITNELVERGGLYAGSIALNSHTCSDLFRTYSRSLAV